MKRFDLMQGVYDAKRAARLAGVSESTVRNWEHRGLVTPSVSAVRTKYWSYADLLTLRIIAWLRKTKPTGQHADPSQDPHFPAATMDEVVRALDALDESGMDLWSPGDDGGPVCPLMVDASGRIILRSKSGLLDVPNQPLLDNGMLNLLAEFDLRDGVTRAGPNLVVPGRGLAIVPGKLSGEPHLAGTRIGTLSVYALANDGYTEEQIAKLLDVDDARSVRSALDLEERLAA